MCTVQAGIFAAQMIGTGIRAYGLFQQGRNESAEARYRSQVASNNAIIAEQNAEAALDKGRVDTEDERRRIKQLIGLQRAQLAGAGFDVSGGSSIDILGDTAALGELDVLRIQADAENTARNFKIQAQGFQSEATLGRFASRNARRAGRLGVASTLITGAGRSGSFLLRTKP